MRSSAMIFVEPEQPLRNLSRSDSFLHAIEAGRYVGRPSPTLGEINAGNFVDDTWLVSGIDQDRDIAKVNNAIVPADPVYVVNGEHRVGPIVHLPDYSVREIGPLHYSNGYPPIRSDGSAFLSRMTRIPLITRVLRSVAPAVPKHREGALPPKQTAASCITGQQLMESFI